MAIDKDRFITKIDEIMTSIHERTGVFYNRSYFWNVIRWDHEGLSFINLVDQQRWSPIMKYAVKRRESVLGSRTKAPIFIELQKDYMTLRDYQLYRINMQTCGYMGNKLWTDDFTFFLGLKTGEVKELPIRLVKCIEINHKKVFP